jgi:dienelactone hydrolase
MSDFGLRAFALTWFCLAALPAVAGEREVVRGTVRFEPTAAEGQVAERFRMTAHSFDWEARKLGAESKHIDLWDVTFPSPVVTDHESNNTIYGEYYQPKRPGKRPAVIVLHILGGDFPLSRVFSNMLAQHGVAALFIKLPYYGERQAPGSERRMISTNADETVAGMTQAILDIRQATAWLAAREEVDPDQIGVFGISLGGITGALAACNEPRISNVCLLLAGGDVHKIPWDSPELRKVRGKLPFDNTNRDAFLAKLAVIDPVNYAAGAKGKRILLLNATDDEVIPRECTESLWKAFGEPEIAWYRGGHYSVVRHVFGALHRVSTFFAATAADAPAAAKVTASESGQPGNPPGEREAAASR